SESRRMFQNHSRLEFVARAGHLTQSMNVFQRHPRCQRSYGGANSPTIHGLQLSFCIGELDRHRAVRILRRDHMVMHIKAPNSLWLLVPKLNCFRTQIEESLYMIPCSVAPRLFDKALRCQLNAVSVDINFNLGGLEPQTPLVV